MIKNYYQILNLSPDCNKDDIKKAYRMYATKFHPDKQNNDKFFEERFKEIKEAYDVLIDDNKRAQFDNEYKSTFENYSSNYNSSQNQYKKNSVNDYINQLLKERKETEQKENIKRKKVFYTSKNLIINGLYINSEGKSFLLTDYDYSTIRKDDNSNFIFIGIIMIIIGVITLPFIIGIFILSFGLFGLFYREYFIVLIGKRGDTALIKGRKSKMRRISKLINRAMKENV